MDQEIESLRRSSRADPSNEIAALTLLHARARAQGSQVYLEPLQDRLQWNRCPDSVRDLALKEVAATLGPSYELLSTRSYCCNRFDKAGQEHKITTFKHRKTGAELGLIPGGQFMMGGAQAIERPVHEVIIERPFLLGRFPLLQKEWDCVDQSDGRYSRGELLPMEGISWEDAQRWLEKVGDGLRLPAESEWEYACRAGTSTQYFWGDGMDSSFCWHGQNSGYGTHEVVEHQNKWNAFGLVDMSGNVWEWCRDSWIGDYFDGPDSQRPRETGSSSLRVLRGGSWNNLAPGCNSASRRGVEPGVRLHNFGIRLARSLD